MVRCFNLTYSMNFLSGIETRRVKLWCLTYHSRFLTYIETNNSVKLETRVPGENHLPSVIN